MSYFNAAEDAELEKLQSLAEEFKKEESKYRGEIDMHLFEAQKHLKALFELSEKSGLPVNFDSDLTWRLEGYKRWTAVFVPKSFGEKFYGLNLEGCVDETRFLPHPWKSNKNYWIASSEC